MPSFKPENIGRSDEHYTQPWVFEKLQMLFDLDVCAPPNGVAWITAENHYSEADDALNKDWYGKVWMNPPYSKPAPWVEKFIAHGNGIALLPFTRGRWFDTIWEAADGICLDRYNNKFVTPDGSSRQITFRTGFFAIGESNAKALERLELGKIR